MMKYSGNMNDDYRLARVLEVFPDSKGLVRTVKVGYRKRDKREKPGVYWKKPLVEEKVAVQRLALLQAVNEPLPTGFNHVQLSPEVAVPAQLDDHLVQQAPVGLQGADDLLQLGAVSGQQDPDDSSK